MKIKISIFLLAVLITELYKAPALAKDKDKTMDQIVNKALQGNTAFGIDLINTTEVMLENKNNEYIQNFKARFDTNQYIPGNKSHTEHPFLNGLIDIYREYWWKVLNQKMTKKDGEQYLATQLSKYVKVNSDDPKKIWEPIAKRLTKNGYKFINGRTLPYLELMVWAKETKKSYTVELIGKTESVDVVLIDDIKSYGWSHFATLGKASTGGWAEKDVLYCVAPKYDLESENYKVSYLKHEAQHFRDYKEFPWLEQFDLEYRAKLTELAFANKGMKKLLEKFINQSSDNKDDPHSVANKKVIDNLISESKIKDANKLLDISGEKINSIAVTLFELDTKRLKSDKENRN